MSRSTFQINDEEIIHHLAIPEYQVFKLSDAFQMVSQPLGHRGNSLWIKYCDNHPDEAKTYFLKRPHHDEAANLEILSAKLMALTGIKTPKTFFCPSKRTEEKFVYIASQRIKGYRDLSSFLTDFLEQRSASVLGYGKKAEYLNLLEKLKTLKEQGNEADIKKRRIGLYSQIYQLLPQVLKDSFNELYACSLWLGHWDFLNFSMDNCGFVVEHKKKGDKKYVDISASMVDFGNCLYSGFKGERKRYSYSYANMPAKQKLSNPKDYDPELDKEHKISSNSAIFDSYFQNITLENIPRRLPFEGLFDEVNQLIQKKISGKIETAKGKEFATIKGFVKGIYRLSKLSDADIKDVVGKWFHIGGDDIKYKDSDNFFDEDSLSKVLIARRDKVIQLFSKELEHFTLAYKNEAREIDGSIKTATCEILPPKTEVTGAGAVQNLIIYFTSLCG